VSEQTFARIAWDIATDDLAVEYYKKYIKNNYMTMDTAGQADR
jgi:hypothetical protein